MSTAWEINKSLGGKLGKILALLRQIRDEHVFEKMAEREQKKLEALIGLQKCLKNGKA